MTDSDTWLTQCPNCNTRFRVNDVQLKVARGSVKCGKCKTIFNALANSINEEPQNKKIIKKNKQEVHVKQNRRNKQRKNNLTNDDYNSKRKQLNNSKPQKEKLEEYFCGRCLIY